ncbi:MAG: hypothetical protein NXI24_11495 [bacterium]|nr:hypothetical protein [bacterium]
MNTSASSKSSGNSATGGRNTFQFGGEGGPAPANDRGPARDLLLWRILQCRPEVLDGRLKLLKNPFRNAIRQNPADFAENNTALVGNLRTLIERTGRSRLDAGLAKVAIEIASAYRRECVALKETHFSISFDFLYQTVQLLSLNTSREEAERTILQMGRTQKGTSLSETDRGRLIRSFRAYVALAGRLKAMRTMRTAVERQDEVIGAVYVIDPAVSVVFLDQAYRSLIAQVILSKKFRCDTLLVEWLREYELEPDHLVRMSQYIPYETEFWQFRKSYRDAIRSLKGYLPNSKNPLDSDLFLLRSLGNFYTSWIMQTSQQIPA